MKKLILPVLFCFCQAAVAQSEFGALAGGNLSWVNTRRAADKSYSTSDLRLGMLLGGYFRFIMSDRFAVQPELMFAGYGGRNFGGQNKVKLNYIALTVLAKVNFTPELFGLTGPQLGMLASQSNQDSDTLTDYKFLYVSWPFGLGYSFNNIGVNVSLRYSLGLADITKSSATNDKMDSFQLAVGYHLAGGDKYK